MAAVTIYSDFGAQENKVSHCSTVSPSICHEVMGLDAMIHHNLGWIFTKGSSEIERFEFFSWD